GARQSAEKRAGGSRQELLDPDARRARRVTAGGWTSVRVRSPRNKAAVVSALFELGAEGVQELDDDVITHIRDLDRSRADIVLLEAGAPEPIEYAATPDVDWSAAWRTRISSHRLGGLVVTPPWLAHQFPPH